jgi:hypothetical protein
VVVCREGGEEHTARYGELESKKGRNSQERRDAQLGHKGKEKESRQAVKA